MVWTLDVVLAGAILVFVSILRRDPEGRTHPWALNAFIVAMGGGFVLVGITAFETLDLSELTHALGALRRRDPRPAEVGQFRAFGRMPVAEIAQATDVGAHVVRARWEIARRFLP